jgi:hypothetical protein
MGSSCTSTGGGRSFVLAAAVPGLRRCASKNKLKTTPHTPSHTTANGKESEPTCIISGGSHLLGALGPPARCKVDQKSTVSMGDHSDESQTRLLGASCIRNQGLLRGHLAASGPDVVLFPNAVVDDCRRRGAHAGIW